MHANNPRDAMSYARPATVTEAIRILRSGEARVLAGGTDIYPATQAQVLDRPVVDLTAIPALRGITIGEAGIRIGACATWTDIAEAALPPALAALQQAARQVGGRQIQNAGTIGGNLCNASPAADGVPPLLVCDAAVEIAGPDGMRQMALADFITGPRKTVLGAAEVLTAVIIPTGGFCGASAFVKLGARAHLVISIAMVAARVVVRDGRIERAALSVGSCSPVARRLPVVEGMLTGLSPKDAAARITVETLSPHLSPIDDIRATGGYRLEAAATLLARAVGGFA
jgi:CO/xanthine dehydrogenase FAD-binding subunit